MRVIAADDLAGAALDVDRPPHTSRDPQKANAALLAGWLSSTRSAAAAARRSVRRDRFLIYRRSFGRFTPLGLLSGFCLALPSLPSMKRPS
jgi:hypothetical protein